MIIFLPFGRHAICRQAISNDHDRRTNGPAESVVERVGASWAQRTEIGVKATLVGSDLPAIGEDGHADGDWIGKEDKPGETVVLTLNGGAATAGTTLTASAATVAATRGTASLRAPRAGKLCSHTRGFSRSPVRGHSDASTRAQVAGGDSTRANAPPARRNATGSRLRRRVTLTSPQGARRDFPSMHVVG